MADHPHNPDDALGGAIEQARGELEALSAPASDADAIAEDNFANYALHEVEGIGRYAVPHHPGWAPLAYALHDAAEKLAFSPRGFPGFDAPLARQHPLELSEPLAEHIAAIRNYLLQLYYSDTPKGMTTEHARNALEEMAQLLADGFYAHSQGRRPVPGQVHFVIAEVEKPRVDGIRYLYSELHRAYRHNAWLRPFYSVAGLFGGRTHSDWQLPPLDHTPFHYFTEDELAPARLGPNATPEEIDAAMQYLDALEGKRQAQVSLLRMHDSVTDLNMLGQQLIHSAEQMQDVSQMSEPVRQDAIDIAREILRKLKVSFGDKNVLHGLDVQPDEDVEELGGVKGVATIYERLLAWGRGIDASIMQHPTILAATHALGQLGYALKLEALRMAKNAGDEAMVALLSQQMGSVPRHYTDFEDEELAVLLYRIEQGIDTVLNRVQEINGPASAVGHSATKELGSSMQSTPTAGITLQTTEAANARQQAAIKESNAAAQRAQAQRVSQQIANQLRSRGESTVGRTAVRGSASAQLAALRTRLAQARRVATANLTNPALRNAAALRAGQLAALHGHEEEEEHNPLAATIAKIDPMVINNIRGATSTAGLTTNPVITGRAAFQKMQKAANQGIEKAIAKEGVIHQHELEDEIRKHHQQDTPPPPNKGGRGI